MNVILLDKVENLGDIGDLVNVKPGYGRNFLLPQGKAALATKQNLAEFEARRADLEKAAAEELASAKARAALIEGMNLVIPANVGSEGKLFRIRRSDRYCRGIRKSGCRSDASRSSHA